MSKKFILIGFVAIMALVFVVARCSREQKNPIAPIQTTAKIQVDGVDPLASVSSGTCADDDPSDRGIMPVTYSGNNPDVCKRLTPGDGAETIVFNLDKISGNDVTVTITVGDCGEVMSWSVPDNIVIDQVIAKGGNAYNVYDYTTKYPSDGNLHSPLTSSGKYAGFSHIDFCFHYKLTISKTAVPEYTRTFEWDLKKNCEGPAELTLSVRQTYVYPFDWTVTVPGYTDSDWKVTGTITIFNNTPLDATITSIEDKVGGVPATVDCAPPFTLAAGETKTCNYSADLAGATNGTNEVKVVTSTPMVEGGAATKDYTFSDPTKLIDDCITVIDNCNNVEVKVCTKEGYSHYYNCPIGPYTECGNYTYTNTATSTTVDRKITTTASCDVIVHVPCAGGCTLTQGYWKTHSSHGPAPYDDTWGGMEDETFFSSGKTYYQVLWTPPAGNVYYNLAHQYIAAKLNHMNGADFSAAQAAFDAATGLFNTKTPAQAATLKGSVKTVWTNLATVLDNYNNGLIGPGHCDE